MHDDRKPSTGKDQEERWCCVRILFKERKIEFSENK